MFADTENPSDRHQDYEFNDANWIYRGELIMVGVRAGDLPLVSLPEISNF